MNGNGYSAHENVSVAFFTREQRQRVEALTLAGKLVPTAQKQVHNMVYLAKFIVTGEG